MRKGKKHVWVGSVVPALEGVRLARVPRLELPPPSHYHVKEECMPRVEPAGMPVLVL